MKLTVSADDAADVLDQLGEVCVFSRDDGRVGGYAVNGIVFDTVADAVQIGGINNVHHKSSFHPLLKVTINILTFLAVSVNRNSPQIVVNTHKFNRTFCCITTNIVHIHILLMLHCYLFTLTARNQSIPERSAVPCRFRSDHTHGCWRGRSVV